MMSDEKQLAVRQEGPLEVPTQQERLKVISEMKARIEHDDIELLSYEALAAELDDNGNPPENWTKKQKAVARAALKPKKSMPGYLEHAQARYLADKRIEANKPPPAQSLGIVYIVQKEDSLKRYDIIDVPADEEDD